MLPDLNTTQSASLRIFAPTADQRFLLGSELFLRTHFPMRLQRFQNGDSRSVSESQLLEQILNADAVAPGNRLWVLYGAPGSGKSELTRWLEIQVQRLQPERTPVTVRIARTELDVLSIAERFREMQGEGQFSAAVHQRWQAARQKPRTLTKLLLLFALESIMESDDTINALFYRLLHVLQPHVEQVLATGQSRSSSASLELVSLEVWEAILRETSLSVTVDYEHFRHQLTVAFQHHMLEGLSLASMLSHISLDVKERLALRPLLLVDDLVQSMSLFATDLLDYFMSLESGNWDVVFGLTPAAFSDTHRGRLLLQRISHLDTFDDRVEKLWLSDESGRDSYVVTEASCHDFLRPYLQEYQQQNGWQGLPSLYPFNREALVRIFRGLPAGKGKARYLLKSVHSVLERTGQGEGLLDAISHYAKCEYVARCDDKTLAQLCEIYGPLTGDTPIQEVIVSADLLASFGYVDQTQTIAVEPLLRSVPGSIASHMPSLVEDDSKAAVRDWILERPVNRQLLRDLRRGAARLVRTQQAANLLYREHIARPNGVLRWQRSYLETCPPILLEGVDDTTAGLLLSRNIGWVAYDLSAYAGASGQQARTLGSQLAASPQLIDLLLQAAEYRRDTLAHLEVQLGASVEETVLALFVWIASVTDLAIGSYPGFDEGFCALIQRYPLWRHGLPHGFIRKVAPLVLRLFDDFFKLRENLYDAPLIGRLLSGRAPGDVMALLCRVEPSRVDVEFQLGTYPFCALIGVAAKSIGTVETTPFALAAMSSRARSVFDKLNDAYDAEVVLAEVEPEVWAEIRSATPDLYQALTVRVARNPRGLAATFLPLADLE